jgi:UTP-glucose-1-phosphate uridylyltransferase
MEAELCHLREFIEIDYAVQRVDDVPSGVFIPVERKKPWGTAHAVFVARNFVRGSFLTVNGDDYYAPGVWECLDEVLAQHQDASAMVAHRLSATLPDSGPVSRGICEFAEGYVRKIREFSTIARAENQRAVDARTGTIFHADVPVSMNFFYLQPSVLHLFSAEARAFFAQPDDVLLDAEWQLPAVIDALLQKRKMILRGVVADCPWCGLTHARDREALEKFLDESSSKPNLRS